MRKGMFPLLAKVFRHIFLICILPLLGLYGLEFALDYFGMLPNVVADIIFIARFVVIFMLALHPVPKSMDTSTDEKFVWFPGKDKIFHRHTKSEDK